MGIRKFRSVEEMSGPPDLDPNDPENLAVQAQWTAVQRWLRPWRFPPGVHKHRTIEDAQRARERWERDGTTASSKP